MGLQEDLIAVTLFVSYLLNEWMNEWMLTMSHIRKIRAMMIDLGKK